jgi:hypothetical protein
MYDSGGIPCRYLSASQVLEEVWIHGAKTDEMRKAGAILRKLFANKIKNGVMIYHMPNQLTKARPLSPVRSSWAEGPL